MVRCLNLLIDGSLQLIMWMGQKADRSHPEDHLSALEIQVYFIQNFGGVTFSDYSSLNLGYVRMPKNQKFSPYCWGNPKMERKIEK